MTITTTAARTIPTIITADLTAADITTAVIIVAKRFIPPINQKNGRPLRSAVFCKRVTRCF